MSENNCKHWRNLGEYNNCPCCTYKGVLEEFIKVHGEQYGGFIPPCPFNDENGRIYCFRYEEKPLERYEVIVLSPLEGAESQIIHVSEDASGAQRFIRNRIKIRRVEA